MFLMNTDSLGIISHSTCFSECGQNGREQVPTFTFGAPDETVTSDFDTQDTTVDKFTSETNPSCCKPLEDPIHVEICVTQFNVEKFSTIESHVVQFLRSLGARHVPTLLIGSENAFKCAEENKEISTFLYRCVSTISLLLNEADGVDGYDVSRLVDLSTVPLLLHTYQVVSGDEAMPVHEMVEVGSETINGGTVWLLPSMEMHGIWDSLIFDSNIKLDLLNYARSALLFADRQVSTSIISWNRVVLLYGPPGTGKTSLCRALANKLAIRMYDRYSSTKLIELNTMNLMSKWFSESARLVARMFDAIREYLEAPDHLVCLLVDEVESLTAVRSSAMSGCEPSDAIRVVNAVLTQIDQIKRYPNVLILATSNVTGVIDPAFLDRADIRVLINPPSAPAIYTIYRSCVAELSRVGLVQTRDSRLLSYRALAAMQFVQNKVTTLSMELWQLAERSVGLNGRTLRRLPLLAHAFHLSRMVPSLRYNASFSGRIHVASQTQLDSHASDEVMMMDQRQSFHSVNHSDSNLAVSLQTFMHALRLTIDEQFAEVQALDLASSEKGRLTARQRQASISGGSKIAPTHSAGDG